MSTFHDSRNHRPDAYEDLPTYLSRTRENAAYLLALPYKIESIGVISATILGSRLRWLPYFSSEIFCRKSSSATKTARPAKWRPSSSTETSEFASTHVPAPIAAAVPPGGEEPLLVVNQPQAHGVRLAGDSASCG